MILNEHCSCVAVVAGACSIVHSRPSLGGYSRVPSGAQTIPYAFILMRIMLQATPSPRWPPTNSLAAQTLAAARNSRLARKRSRLQSFLTAVRTLLTSPPARTLRRSKHSPPLARSTDHSLAVGGSPVLLMPQCPVRFSPRNAAARMQTRGVPNGTARPTARRASSWRWSRCSCRARPSATPPRSRAGRARSPTSSARNTSVRRRALYTLQDVPSGS
jgi:hypothetical protein